MNHPPDSGCTDERPLMAAIDADTAISWTSLSGFQRDLLLVLKRLEGDQSPPSGTCIGDAMSEYYGSQVDHGRLYRNLNQLVEKGLVEKSIIDGRTNAYLLTDDAEHVLREATQVLEWACGVQTARWRDGPTGPR